MSPNVRGWQLIFGNGAQHLQRWWRHLKIVIKIALPSPSPFLRLRCLLPPSFSITSSHWFLFLFVYLSFFHPFFFLTLSPSLIFICFLSSSPAPCKLLFCLSSKGYSQIKRSECIQFKICCSFFYTMLFHLEGTS